MTSLPLDQQGAVYCKEVLSKEMSEFLTRVLLRKSQVAPQSGDSQIPNALAIIDHDLMLETIHEKLWPMLEVVIGAELLPTYTYSRLYSNGDVLKIHKDRPACEVSITVQLGRSHHYAWPIYAAGKPYYLAEGDGVVYKGCDIDHWRDACEGPEGYYSGQAFFHFVYAHGQYVSEYGDSTNRVIPENFYVRHRSILMDTK